MTPIEEAMEELFQALGTFTRLLDQEAQALQDIHADTLSAVVAEKTRWSEATNTAWNRLVAAAGVDLRRGEKLENTLAQHPVLHAKWRQIRQLAEAAERTNRANSVLIDAQMRRTRQALDVLTNAAHSGSLYGANGLIVDGFQTQHSLDKA